MSGIEHGLLELADYVRDDWAFDVVFAAAMYHSTANKQCVGFTITSAGRALCGHCGWQLSARLDDSGEVRSGAFALFALGRIGAAIAIAQEVAVAFMEERYGSGICNVKLDGQGGILATKIEPIHEAVFTHRVLL